MVKESCLLNRCISRIHHTGTVTRSGCHLPCAGGHKTSRPDGPSHRRRCPRKAFAVAASLLECARSTERETAWLFLRFRYRRRSVGTTTPKESGEGQWPGFGLRWSVVEAQQWCGGYHPSPVVVTAPCRSHRPLSSSPPPVVVTAPCRRHRPRSSSPPPVVVTDTICIPGASAASPGIPSATPPSG